MAQRIEFDQLLEAVEHLPDEEQADLVDVIRRRLAERARQRLIDEVRQGREEFAEGKSAAMNVADLMRDIKS